MNATVREIIRLALENDSTVSRGTAQAVWDVLDGRLAPIAEGEHQPLLMTMTSAAKLLGVSRVTTWRMVKEGILKPVEITPRVFRVRRLDIENISLRHSEYRPTRRGMPCVE
ncbi:MAG: helix-turn-helix domain-containing protein [Kiritimatiellae bacterium]|nr:helix-turn-helix domain-containing protein [Kiritimatiellia bacterium]